VRGMASLFEIQRRSIRQLAQQKPTYLFNTIIAAMGYAKSIGRSPGDFVRFFMERQTGWERLHGNIEAVFQNFVNNFQQHTEMLDDEFKVFVTERGVVLVTEPIEKLFREDAEKWGLTPEELREGWGVSAEYISRFTGLEVRYDHFDEKHFIHIARARTEEKKEIEASAT